MPMFDPTRPAFAPYGLTCERWVPARMNRADRHNEVELNLVTEGALTYLLGGQRVTVEAGRLALFWAAVPHQVVAARSARDYYVATVPLVWFLQWRLPDRLVAPVLAGHLVGAPDAAAAREDEARFGRWAADLAHAQPDRERAALLEIEARLWRLAAALPAPAAVRSTRSPSLGPGAGSLTKAEQMAAFLARHYQRRIVVAEVAQAVGLHPHYAMALFQNTFGCTINQFLTQQRLTHARRLLVTTDQTVLALARDAGFGSLSRFHEAFRAATGCTPRQYRQRHRVDR